MGRLALDGGSRAAGDLRVPQWPDVTHTSREYVLDAVESGNWCRLEDRAEWVEAFEQGFADFQGVDHAIAVSNGTVAIELALRACGVRPGDEVIVPPYTFIATASAVACVGAVPVFAGVDSRTCNLDPDAVERAVTEDTAGIVGVHFGGYPMDMDALLPIVEGHAPFLVEDAAHAHGTEWRGEPVRTIGDVGTFSFQASKPLAGGEGGLVATDDEKLLARGRRLHNIGRVPDEPGYKHFVLASNYRLSELQRTLLSAQLEKLPDEVDTRERNAAVLRPNYPTSTVSSDVRRTNASPVGGTSTSVSRSIPTRSTASNETRSSRHCAPRASPAERATAFR